MERINTFYFFKNKAVGLISDDDIRRFIATEQLNVRTFALNLNMPSYAAGRCRQVLLYRNRADIGQYGQEMIRELGGWDRIKAASNAQRVGQVLLALGTLACKEKIPLFGTSEWMILALDDPRLVPTLLHYEATEGMFTEELLYIARNEMKTPPDMSDLEVCESYFRYIVNEISKTFKERMILDWLRYYRKPASKEEVEKATAEMPGVQLAVDFRMTGCWGNAKEWKEPYNPGWNGGPAGRLDIF